MTIDEAVNTWMPVVTMGVKDMPEIKEAVRMSIASLEALSKIKQEINDLFSKPACYMPNYDAYKMFLEIIDKHIKEVENDTVYM